MSERCYLGKIGNPCITFNQLESLTVLKLQFVHKALYIQKPVCVAY